jgi:hypothetical protein
MLYQVRQTILIGSLISRTGIDHKATVRHITGMRIVYYLQAIG